MSTFWNGIFSSTELSAMWSEIIAIQPTDNKGKNFQLLKKIWISKIPIQQFCDINEDCFRITFF